MRRGRVWGSRGSAIAAVGLSMLSCTGRQGFGTGADVGAGRLVAVSGDGQSISAGGVGEAPLAVRVESSAGGDVSGVVVTFTVTAGSGRALPAEVTSDELGEAETRLRADGYGGDGVQVRAEAPGYAPVLFRATVRGAVGLQWRGPDTLAQHSCTSLRLLRVDSAGSEVPEGTPVAVTLSVVGAADFFRSAGCGLTLGGAVDIPAGAASVRVYLRDDVAQTVTLRAASRLGSADHAVTVVPLLGAPLDADLGAAPNHLAYGDLDGDGNLDVVACAGSAGRSGVFFGNGDGTFAPRVDLAAASSPDGPTIGDLDQDGRPDVLVASGNGATNSYVNVYLGAGARTFAPRVTYPVASFPRHLRVRDFDHDGYNDVVVSVSSGTPFNCCAAAPAACWRRR